MLTNGKWIAAGAVIVALILTFGDGIYDRQALGGNGLQWYLVNKFTGEAVHICDQTGCLPVEEYQRRLELRWEQLEREEAEREAEREKQRAESRRLGKERRERERQEAHARWTEKLIEHGLTANQADIRIQEHLASGTLAPYSSDFWIRSVPEVVEKRREEMQQRIDERQAPPTAFERFQAQREAERSRLPWMNEEQDRQ